MQLHHHFLFLTFSHSLIRFATSKTNRGSLCTICSKFSRNVLEETARPSGLSSAPTMYQEANHSTDRPDRSQNLLPKFAKSSGLGLGFSVQDGRIWPQDVSDLIDYIEERVGEGCPRSLPGELQAAVVVLESAGRVPDEQSLSKDPTWLAHLDRVLRAQDGSPFHRCHFDQSGVDGHGRGVYLFHDWASMRMDDVQCILPYAVRLSPSVRPPDWEERR